MMSTQDEQFMKRALQLASYGRSTVSPNPMVGCVIVHDGVIVGEGWHQKAGEPHAEVIAIRSVENQQLLKFATAYVTLEPCAHFGKTPPCGQLLIEKKIKRVVIGAMDSNPLVAGKGVQLLENAGLQVIQGVLESECRELNRAFFTYVENRRPYVILKWAETADGLIARGNFDSKWISNALSRQLVHKWRTEVDAILVGKNTVLYDDPQLNSRDWSGKSPIRLVLDHQLVLEDKYRVFDGGQRTVIFSLKVCERRKENFVSIQLNPEQPLEDMMQYLYEQKVQSVIIEGGARTLQSFIDLNLWDEARIFKAPITFEEGIKAAQLKNHKLVSQKDIQDKDQKDVLCTYYNFSGIQIK